MRTKLTPIRAVVGALLASIVAGVSGLAAILLTELLFALPTWQPELPGIFTILWVIFMMPVMVVLMGAIGGFYLLPVTAPAALVAGSAMHFIGRTWAPLASAPVWACAGVVSGALLWKALLTMDGFDLGYAPLAPGAWVAAMAGGAAAALTFRWMLRWDTEEDGWLGA